MLSAEAAWVDKDNKMNGYKNREWILQQFKLQARSHLFIYFLLQNICLASEYYSNDLSKGMCYDRPP